MSGGKAMGFIESLGLASAVTAADAALKAANVALIGRENSRGSGLITIKIVGDVGAVKAAIDVAKAASAQVARVWSTDVIPRPGEGLGQIMVWNSDTQGASEWLGKDLGRSEPESSPGPPSLPAIKDETPLAKRPAHDIVPVDTDIPKPAIIPPEETSPDTANSNPSGADLKQGGHAANPDSAARPKKNPPRRRGKPK
jgi:hypothetical protein